MKKIKFKGVVSGDGESFCFDVDRNTFIAVTEREPENWEDYQSGEYVEENGELRFVPEDSDKCRLYPNDLFGYSNEVIQVEIKIS
ncbi:MULTISPECIES: hypothetical protein [Paenibacillus]|uniref:hypothetical protein n=1 Tax=Paenibacillus TaxID=44249 RepID=UPI00096CD1B4|nr:hypothetical protein [Paenibacillus odorifer]OMD76851.1 hypothetical protein BSK50_13950 [Paenibacillus odorifer]